MLPLKAIPTRYAGVLFRSRLEARWAAFFDLQGWKWKYEPYDFNGWIPDFELMGSIFVEVKPIEADGEHPLYAKAVKHWKDVQVLLLGLEPDRGHERDIGCLLDPPQDAVYTWADLHDRFAIRFDNREEIEANWLEAANRVRYGMDPS